MLPPFSLVGETRRNGLDSEGDKRLGFQPPESASYRSLAPLPISPLPTSAARAGWPVRSLWRDYMIPSPKAPANARPYPFEDLEIR